MYFLKISRYNRAFMRILFHGWAQKSRLMGTYCIMLTCTSPDIGGSFALITSAVRSGQLGLFLLFGGLVSVGHGKPGWNKIYVKWKDGGCISKNTILSITHQSVACELLDV